MGDLIYQSIWMYGLAIVISFVVAIVVKGIVSVLEKSGQEKAKAAAAEAKPQPPKMVIEPGIPAAHVAAIAAAVYSVMGGYRIAHIGEARTGATWSTEGKIMHQTSHNIQRTTRR